MPDSWMERLAGVFPPPVKVAPCQAASIVAINDSIGIKHWNYLEHKFISELWSLRITADQEVNDSFHHPGSIGFTWVDSGANDDSFLLLINLKRHSVCYCEVFTFVTGNSPAKSISGDIVKLSWLDLAQVFSEIWVGVWLSIWKINFIIVVLEGVSKCESVVASLVIGLMLSSVVVLEITHVFSTSLPTSLFIFFTQVLLHFRVV